MLELPLHAYESIVGHCIAGLPDEACGLLAGPPAGSDPGGGGRVMRVYPTANAARSARLYTVDASEHLMADRDAEAHGWEIIGVFHSHTHSDPYPSPTDVAQAPDPNWHYVLVSLRMVEPELRSYRIVGGEISEEAVVVPELSGSQP